MKQLEENSAKLRIRMLNGYRVLYLPNHPSAMTSKNWCGFVYEHIYKIEKSIGRSLRDKEVVHHLNGNRADNRIENLIVLENTQHAKLHMFLSRKNVCCEIKHCAICGICLDNHQKHYCSKQCAGFAYRKVKRPDEKQLKEDVAKMSLVAVGKKYGVSDNTIRKWLKKLGL
jgi:hypothetical protein